jgi:DNA mismatch repair ATPase MutL
MKKNITYCFVNNRPINPLKNVTKIFNDIYKIYNPNGKYMYFIDITVDNFLLDFNLTPDKRDKYLKNEAFILKKLRDELV